ncbi:MAG: hypothetical protein AAF720_03360 [Pseudomonadota bacterium]
MRVIMIAALSLSISACSTVMSGGKETATFKSLPPGAIVTVEARGQESSTLMSCKTPCTLELVTKLNWRADFNLEGYQSVSGLLSPQHNVENNGMNGGRKIALKPDPLVAYLMPLGLDTRSRINAPQIIDHEKIAETKADFDELPIEDPIVVGETLTVAVIPSIEVDPKITPESRPRAIVRNQPRSRLNPRLKPTRLEQLKIQQSQVADIGAATSTKPTARNVKLSFSGKAPSKKIERPNRSAGKVMRVPSIKRQSRSVTPSIKPGRSNRSNATENNELTSGIDAYAEGEKNQREYEPGEPAPHDEISDELNRRILDAISPN